MKKPDRYCFLTFDIEEWFQVENLKSAISRDEWKDRTTSVEKNTGRILDLLDSFNVKATFFILGWIAKRHPELIRRIAEKGHEVACHGYGHDLTFSLSAEALQRDISDSKKILEDTLGKKVDGYRAPSFSVDNRLFEILKELEFLYDSSLNPFKLNKRHGKINGEMKKIGNGYYETEWGVYEVPISTVLFNRFNFPIGGGAYFRIMPFYIFRNLVKRKLQQEPVFNFYLHPWEFEPEQEKIKNIPLNYRFRHYYGLHTTNEKLSQLIRFLKGMNCQFSTLKQYITEQKKWEK